MQRKQGKQAVLRKLTGLACSGLVAASTLVIVGQTPAHAVGAAAATMFGSGTMSPGLTTVPTPQSFTMSSANLGGFPSVMAGASTNGGAVSTLMSCTFTGSSTLAGGETTAAGLGTGSGNCTTATSLIGTGGIACSVTYIRVGPFWEIVITCTSTVNGNSNNSGVGIGICAWVATSANPTTSYQIVCQFIEVITNV
jgi:hypothetical protein